MKPATPKKPKPTSLTTAIGRALRRAGKVARKTARDHGTLVYYWKDGKVVGVKP